jgi:DNA-binding LytR/AlgR family response regulator
MKKSILPRNIELSTEGFICIQSDNNFTHIISQKQMLVALSLCKIQASLNKNEFIRGSLVNAKYVSSPTIQKDNLMLILINGESFTTSRRRTEKVLQLLSN